MLLIVRKQERTKVKMNLEDSFLYHLTEHRWKATSNHHFSRSSNTKTPENREVHLVIHKEKAYINLVINQSMLPSIFWEKQNMSTFFKKHPWWLFIVIANPMLFMYKMYVFAIISFSPVLPFFWSYLLKFNFMSVESYKKLSFKKIIHLYNGS